MYKSNKHTILDHLLVQYHYTTILFNFGQFKFSLEQNKLFINSNCQTWDELIIDMKNKYLRPDKDE